MVYRYIKLTIANVYAAEDSYLLSEWWICLTEWNLHVHPSQINVIDKFSDMGRVFFCITKLISH